MFLDDGPLDFLLIRNDEAEVWDAQRIERGDLTDVFHDVPNVAGGGFKAEVPMQPFAVGDRFAFTLLGFRDEQAVARRRIEFQRIPEGTPMPPEELIEATSGSPDARRFNFTGRTLASDLMRTATIYQSQDEIRDVLEIGCGCGWLSRHLAADLGDAAYHGVDLDPTAAAWADANLPGSFAAMSQQPPIPHGEQSFDLIFAPALFDHLDRDSQQVWISELRRLLRPNGVAVVAAYGRHAAFLTGKPSIIETLGPDSQDLYEGVTVEAADAEPDHPYYRSTFVTPEFIGREWSPHLHLMGSFAGAFGCLKDIHLLAAR